MTVQKVSKRLTRTEAAALATKLYRESTCCPICMRSWASIEADYLKKLATGALKRKQVPYILDHDHDTGLVRGVLCRGCNGAEGKVANVVATWGKQGGDYKKIKAWLRRLITYLDSAQLPYMYPTHLDAEEKAAKAKDKRLQAARKKAAMRMKIVGK